MTILCDVVVAGNLTDKETVVQFDQTIVSEVCDIV